MAYSYPPDARLELVSGGYHLFVPPTRLWAQPRVVALDDSNDAILSIEYETATLHNLVPWSDLALHNVTAPAIVFPREVDQAHETHKFVKCRGFLVSIQSTTPLGVLVARQLGIVEIAQFPQTVMNWDVLDATYQPEIVQELRRGFLRHMFDNGQHGLQAEWDFSTPAAILDAMPRRWDQDPGVLNEEIYRGFVGASRIANDQRWSLGI